MVGCPEHVLSMKHERERVNTFKSHGWTNLVVRPDDLALCGFYMLKDGDNVVQCFACGVKLYDWKASDVPYLEHAKYSPECPFITGKDCTNVPIDSLQDIECMRSKRDALLTTPLFVSDPILPANRVILRQYKIIKAQQDFLLVCGITILGLCTIILLK